MRLFAIIGGLVLTLLIAVLVVPYFVNWSDYKGRFETAASQLTGLQVHVDGDADVRLLPFPSLSFGQVRIGSVDDAVALIDRFSVDVELAPFLTGEMHIFDMRLDGAKFVLDPRSTRAVALDLFRGSDLASIIQDIKLEQATITNGSVVVRDDAGGDAWRIASLNGILSADSRVGPFRFMGDGVANGVPVSGQLSTGRVREDGFSLNTKTSWRNRGIAVSTQGKVVRAHTNSESAVPDQLHYDGTVQVSPLADAANVPETPFIVEGVFVATDNQLTIDQYRASFGAGSDPYTVEGDFVLTGGDVPTYMLNARGTQVNWAGLAEDDQAFDFEVFLEQGRAVFAQLPLPTVAGTVAIDLPAIVYGATTVRDVRFNAIPAEQNNDGSALWRITRLEATLPGRTQLEASGEVSLPGRAERNDDIVFNGRMVLASRQPSGFASWLGLGRGLALSRLNRAGLEADVRLTAYNQMLSNMSAIVDGDTFGGSIERSVERSVLGARPMIKTTLSGDALRDPTFDVFGDLLAAIEPRKRADTDIDLAVDFTNIQHKGLLADHLTAMVRVRPQQWSVDRFQVDGFYGASLSATATIRPDGQAHATDFDVSLVSADGAALVSNLGHIGDYFSLGGTLDAAPYVLMVSKKASNAFGDVNITAKGLLRDPQGDGAMAVDAAVNGVVGGTEIGANLRFNGALSQWDRGVVGIDATIRNDQSSVLAAQLGIFLLDDQSGDLTVRVSGQPSLGMAMTLGANMSNTNIRFDGETSVTPVLDTLQFTAAGALLADGTDAGALAKALALPIESSSDNPSAFDLASRLIVDGTGGVSLSSLDVKAGDVSAGGNLTFYVRDMQLFTQGSLSFNVLDITPFASAFAGLERQVQRSNPFSASRLNDYVTRLDLTSDQLIVAGVDHAITGARLTLSQNDSGVQITDISAAMLGGEVSGRLDVQNLSGALLSDFQLQLKAVDLASLLASLGTHANGFNAHGDLSLSGTANGSSIEAMLGSVTGSGSLNVAAVILDGFKSNGLASLVAAADDIGFGISDDQLADLVSFYILTGTTRFEPFQAPVALTNGVARLPSTSVQSNDDFVDGLATGQMILNADNISASLDMRFNQRDEVVTGLVPGLVPSVKLTLEDERTSVDFAGLQTYLVQRSIDREQQRIEALQARLSERQRLRRAVRQANYQRDLRLEAERIEREQRAAAQARRQQQAQQEQERLERLRAQQRQLEQQNIDDPFRREIERQKLPPILDAPRRTPSEPLFNDFEFDN